LSTLECDSDTAAVVIEIDVERGRDRETAGL